MKIQIIALGMTDQSHRKFYNTQDMGLGRALAAMGHTVDMYSFISGDADETVEFSERLHMHYLHTRSFGFHSMHSCDFITPDVDGVICFSDNQMNFKRVRKVCRRKNVVCLPYVGALGSHNTSFLRKKLLDILIPNLRYYRRMIVMAKTPNVKREMEKEGIKDVIVAPCCLDTAAVQEDYRETSVASLRAEIGFLPEQKVILFLARLIDEKHPLEMLDIFAGLYQKDSSYRLISIGKGELQQAFEEKIDALGLRPAVCRIESVENSMVWKYYRMSDVMVNLNRVEIFGMAILEAMYYECPVVARRAPGPEYILTDGKDGFLCADSAQVAACVEKLCGDREYRESIAGSARERILKDFTWESTAGIMAETIRKEKRLRVLHILHEIHPSGAEMMIYNAAPYWEESCACTVMATGNIRGPFAKQLEQAGYTVAWVATEGQGKKAKIKHLISFWKFMRVHKYDIVHIHRESLAFEYALIAALTGCRHIVRTVHSTFAHTGVQRRIKSATRRIMRNALGVRFVAISDGVAANEKKVFHNPCGTVIYNWCDNRQFTFVSKEEKELAKREKGMEKKFVLVTVGNCGDVKNHSLLVRALGAMEQKDAVVYRHVGYAKGETEKEMRLAGELGVAGQISFEGSAKPMPYLREADVFVMTSRYEGLSIAALEAIFTGMNVLLAEVPGLVEFQGKGLENVSYFEPDPKRLAKALDELVSEWKRGGFKPSVRQAERAKELYDCAGQAQKYMLLYQDLAGKKEK